nr:MAG TPA: hypothetical protein [Caudoviricetes sp.]
MVELKLDKIEIRNSLSMTPDSELYIEKYGTDNYEELKNLPKLNGEVFIGDKNEIDPTVPLWAKSNAKPSYKPEEVGIESISLEEIDKLFNSL